MLFESRDLTNKGLLMEQIPGPTCYGCSNGQMVTNDVWPNAMTTQMGHWANGYYTTPPSSTSIEFCIKQGTVWGDNGLNTGYGMTQYQATVDLGWHPTLPPPQGTMSINEYWFTDQALVQAMCTSGSTSNMEYCCTGGVSGQYQCLQQPIGTGCSALGSSGPYPTMNACQTQSPNCGGMPTTEWWCSVSGIAGPNCYDTPIGQGPNDPNDQGPFIDQQDCQAQCGGPPPIGCTDPTALNFDPMAFQPCTGIAGPPGTACMPGIPPGTPNCCCDYGTGGQFGCMDPSAQNYDPTAMMPCDGMSPGSPPCIPNVPPGPDCCCDYGTGGDYWCEVLPCQIPPCPTQCVGPMPTPPPNMVGGPFIDQQDCQANGCGTMGSIAGCNDPQCANFDPNAIGCPDPMGNPDPNDTSCCTGCGTPIPGCLDPSSSNYNPSATVDCAGNPVPPGGGYGDTSCCTPPPIPGCTDQNALNYNSSATVDDGSCDYGWMCKQIGNHWKFGKKCKKNNDPNQPWDFATKDDCLESGCEPLEADHGKDMVAMAKDNKDYDWMNFGNETDEKKENLREEFLRMKTLWKYNK